jgi:hypothetical protein
MTAKGITCRAVNPYRLDATFGGQLKAWALQDLWGWAIHARDGYGRVYTVGRVGRKADPADQRAYALAGLRYAASRAIDDAVVRIGSAA